MIKVSSYAHETQFIRTPLYAEPEWKAHERVQHEKSVNLDSLAFYGVIERICLSIEEDHRICL